MSIKLNQWYIDDIPMDPTTKGDRPATFFPPPLVAFWLRSSRGWTSENPRTSSQVLLVVEPPLWFHLGIEIFHIYGKECFRMFPKHQPVIESPVVSSYHWKGHIHRFFQTTKQIIFRPCYPRNPRLTSRPDVPPPSSWPERSSSRRGTLGILLPGVLHEILLLYVTSYIYI